MKLFCKHEWKTLSNETFESEADNLIKTLHKYGRVLKSGKINTSRTNIHIMQCEKCGKLEKFVTKV